MCAGTEMQRQERENSHQFIF